MPTSRLKPNRILIAWTMGALVCLTMSAVAMAGADDSVDRATWLLNRMEQSAPNGGSGTYLQKDEFGQTLVTPKEAKASAPKGQHSPWLMLASAVVPGSGEILMGNWVRGSALVAADAYSWYKVKELGDEGNDLEDEYLAFADEHWSEANLFEGYFSSSVDLMRGGVGLTYFDLADDQGNPVSQMTSIDDLHYLTLWVSQEEDRREYYENLGKWDQFVFGWDDFRNPSAPPAGTEYTPNLTLEDLRQPWTSFNRETYREMREKSNDAFKRQDRYLYVNIGLRLFSVLEVAYLQGWLGGAKENLEVAGHEVRILAEPKMRGQSTLAAQVSF